LILMYDIQGRMNRAPSRSILCDGIKGEKQRGGLTEWESRVSANQKMARLYLHTYIHTHIHTYRNYLSSGRRGRKDSDSLYISHQHISLTYSASACNRLTRSGRWMEKRCKEKFKQRWLPYKHLFHWTVPQSFTWLVDWLLSGCTSPKDPG